ncbi:Ubiquitin carboxyl-terminal hydrolase 1 [Trichoplax sp. H2]|nr:Ubiquitin carboxyl-terminal hydrolase 1 [Trichoplax sp. H2]|eukprot:RDD39856.1 Ubiquitin carboxyl-terminal hydrolase 1 [Trichoplax sp. H2]
MSVFGKKLCLKLKRKRLDSSANTIIAYDKRSRDNDKEHQQDNHGQRSSAYTSVEHFSHQGENKQSSLPCYCGLVNDANNCYISCIIQALRLSTHFVAIINTVYDSFSKDELLNNTSSHWKSSTLIQLRKLIHEMQIREQAKEIKSITPIHLDEFLTSVWNNSQSFLPNSQHDAHEFLHFMLKYLEDGCKLTANETLQSNFASIFKGTLLFKTRCLECENAHEKKESFHDISLSLDSTTTIDTVKLSSLLEKFTTVDYLDGVNKYYCEHCRNYTEAEIGIVFDEIPKVLIFHLKRLTSFDAYGYNRKIMTSVVTCTELVLDQCALCSNGCKARNETYQLSAIIVHTGMSGSSGHYYSYVRVLNPDQQQRQDTSSSTTIDSNGNLGMPNASSSSSTSSPPINLSDSKVTSRSVNMLAPMWILFNDTVVKWVNSEQLLNILEPKGLSNSSTAYILIYTQI